MRSLDGGTTLAQAPGAGARYEIQTPLLSLPDCCQTDDGAPLAATPCLETEDERAHAHVELRNG